MTYRLPISFVASALLLAACPGDDTSTDGTGNGSTSTGNQGTTTDEPPPVTTDGTTSTDGGTTESADSTDGGSTSSGSDSGSTGDDSGTSSDSGESGSSESGGMPSCGGPEVLLYEQAPMIAEPGAPAGEGVGGFIRSADDFTIDAADGCWCVSRVVLDGSFIDSMLSGDLEIGFLADGGGVPVNPPVASESGVPIDTDGVFDYTLADPVALPADTYWLSAMPQIPDIEMGIWMWTPGATTNGAAWAMETDFPAFVPTCQNWNDGTTCFPPSLAVDTAFQIYGVVGGEGCM